MDIKRIRQWKKNTVDDASFKVVFLFDRIYGKSIGIHIKKIIKIVCLGYQWPPKGDTEFQICIIRVSLGILGVLSKAINLYYYGILGVPWDIHGVLIGVSEIPMSP